MNRTYKRRRILLKFLGERAERIYYVFFIGTDGQIMATLTGHLMEKVN